MQRQKMRIETAFKEWKANQNELNDICVVGVRLASLPEKLILNGIYMDVLLLELCNSYFIL